MRHGTKMTNAVLKDSTTTSAHRQPELPHFNEKILQTGITFDDVLVLPRFSEIVPAEVNTATRLTNAWTPSSGLRHVLAGLRPGRVGWGWLLLLGLRRLTPRRDFARLNIWIPAET